MKKLLLLFTIAVMFSSCNNDSKKKLVGEWKEYWGVGQETDVTYNNIFKIQLTTDDSIIIKCVSSEHYLFDKVLFDGSELSFRKENISDPNEIFFVYYKLKFKDDYKWMEGPIVNSKNQTDNLKWEKIK